MNLGPDPHRRARTLLEVRNLHTWLRAGDETVRAVDGASFRIEAGETFCLVGESGSGKSVSALSVIGLLPADLTERCDGEVLFRLDPGDGAPPRDLLRLHEDELMRVRGGHIAMIFQEPMTSLNPVLTVGDQIVEAIRLARPNLGYEEAYRRAIEALAEVRIERPELRVDEYPHRLSGGQRQRVMIAMAIACRPELLIADEPTTALDVTVQAEILSLMQELKRRRGMSLFFITHDFGVVAQIADRVAVMREGRIVETGPLAEVLGRPAHEYTRQLLAAVPENLARASPRTPAADAGPRPADTGEDGGTPRDGETSPPASPVEPRPGAPGTDSLHGNGGTPRGGETSPLASPAELRSGAPDANSPRGDDGTPRGGETSPPASPAEPRPGAPSANSPRGDGGTPRGGETSPPASPAEPRPGAPGANSPRGDGGTPWGGETSPPASPAEPRPGAPGADSPRGAPGAGLPGAGPAAGEAGGEPGLSPPSAGPAAALPPLVRLEGLEVHFPIRQGVLKRTVGHVRAVDGVDLRIDRGQILALVGESGCGKTTLARAVLRLVEPTGGRVHFDGRELTGLTRRELRPMRRRLQYVFQDPASSLNPRLTVATALTEPMAAHGIGESQEERLETAARTLVEVQLTRDHLWRYPHELSGGQRQRIGIARALGLRPDFVVCDEVTGALDVSVQAEVLRMLLHLRREHALTLLFITHDIGVVEYLSDVTAVMHGGKIVERGPTMRVCGAPEHPYTRRLIAAVPRLPGT